MKNIVVLVLILGVSCAGCSGLPKRNPVPVELADEAGIPGIPDARYWADDVPARSSLWNEKSTAELKRLYPEVIGTPHNYLAISGGGPRGAFAAGLLNGWTAAGTRPEFTAVTGVSTGALIAPFAFLGSDYDDVLEEIYTEVSTDDILKERSVLKILTLDAITDTTPLMSLIEKYFDEQVLQAVAKKYERGYTLIIVTTDLDAARPVAWDIGAIAISGQPQALSLIHNILLASASIPAAFPPVMFEVEAEGQIYDEMHVDGGATSQLHLYPLSVDFKERNERYEVQGKPTVYVIRNGYVEAKYESVDRNTLAIAAASLGTLMGNISYGDMYRIFLEAQRDGLDFRLAYVPDDFQAPMAEPFDPSYMGMLYELGFSLAKDGYEWATAPPGFLIDPSDE